MVSGPACPLTGVERLSTVVAVRGASSSQSAPPTSDGPGLIKPSRPSTTPSPLINEAAHVPPCSSGRSPVLARGPAVAQVGSAPQAVGISARAASGTQGALARPSGAGQRRAQALRRHRHQEGGKRGAAQPYKAAGAGGMASRTGATPRRSGDGLRGAQVGHADDLHPAEATVR